MYFHYLMQCTIITVHAQFCDDWGQVSASRQGVMFALMQTFF